MTTAHDLIPDHFAPMVESGTRLTTWYAQGHSDGFGDRLLMFDNTSAPSWEILRFKPILAAETKFETALRHRVEQLSSFHHPAFPIVRSIKELGHEQGLAVVSTYFSGVRLSDALRKPRSTEFALQLVRQLMPALTALHEHAPGLAHGALTLDRIVLTSDGRLMIREHMLASAIEGLDIPAADVWAAFGILAPVLTLSSPALDSRSDVTQLALIALSLVGGRRIGPQDYPHGIRELLDKGVRSEFLRQWIERALYLDDNAFASGREANEALSEISTESRRDDDGFEAALRLAAPRAPQPGPVPAAPPLEVERQHPLAPTGIVPVSPPPRAARSLRWAAIAATVIAIVEAAMLAYLLNLNGTIQFGVEATASTAAQPLPDVSQTPALSLPPFQMKVEPDAPPIQVVPAVAAADPDPKLIDVRSPAENGGQPPAAAPRNGGFRVNSPIELHVLDGERVLGSTSDGPIMARAGRHQLDFVNSVIGYRVRREVEIKPGEVLTLPLVVPNGTININATPWATVSIDGTSYGETPLGNVSIVPGEHEIVFRHPQLGERRERIIVRPESVGRVAVNMQR
jgi:hypothetical protein